MKNGNIKQTTHRGFTITDNKHYFSAVCGKIRYDSLTYKEAIKKIDFHLDGKKEVGEYKDFLITQRILPEKTYFFASDQNKKIPCFFSAKTMEQLYKQIDEYLIKQ